MLLPKFNFKQIFQRSDSILNPIFQKQLYVSLIVNIVIFSHGIGTGWISPTLLRLQSVDTPLRFQITINEASWIGSIIAFGSIAGNLIQSVLNRKLGPKFCLYIMAMPSIFGWFFVYFAQSVEHIYVARILIGITSGASFILIALFVSEISDKNMRGTFSSFPMVALNLGILIGFILSSKLNYYAIPCIVITVSLPFFFLFLYFPQTPQQLIRKGKDKMALESLRFYRNYKRNTAKCEQEFNELKTAIIQSKSDTELIFSDFTTKPALKAYSTIFILLILNQFSGLYAFALYASEIFTISGTPFDPNTSTILIGFVQLIGMLFATKFVDRIGRRLLMFFSTGGIALGLASFGCYTEFGKLFLDTEIFNWIPLSLMAFIIFSGNIGIAPLLNIIIVEILPVKIRPVAISGCFLLLNTIIFGVLKSFPLCLYYFGISITFWFCAFITIICLIYLIIFLPETNGKSIDED